MTVLFQIAAIFVLGISAQWIAWRYSIPSILLLLIFGFVAGPITGILQADALQGDWVLTFVGISVGIILFEGGLTLRLDEFREVGGAVFRLITLGVVVTWTLAAVAAYYLLGYSFSMSVLIGAILTVTGPTVIIPLLRLVRPMGRVGTIAKWEGITIDPAGAILAVLVLETVILVNDPAAATFGDAALHAAEGLLLQLVVGFSIGIAGAAVLILLLRHRLVPDYLQNSTALMVVIAVFASAAMVLSESGLVATTLMGFFVANQKYVAIRRIVEFKEDLRVLLISVLFIVLAARLTLDHLTYIGGGAILFLLTLMVVVRPASVFLSTIGTNINWREQAFLSWLAPRGVVAASVASLFSFRLETVLPGQAESLVPIVFLVIIGTVAIYGLTISPVARWLALADPNPQGILIVGGHEWAREIAAHLHQHDVSVLLIDSNPSNVILAHNKGIPAKQENILSEDVLDRLSLSGIGRLLTLTPNDEVNALAVLHFNQIFDSAEIYQLAARDEHPGAAGEVLPPHLRGRRLFGTSTYASITESFERGAEVCSFEITDEYTFDRFGEEYAHRATLLFVLRGTHVHVVSDDAQVPKPSTGHVVIALVDPPNEADDSEEKGSFSFAE